MSVKLYEMFNYANFSVNSLESSPFNEVLRPNDCSFNFIELLDPF